MFSTYVSLLVLVLSSLNHQTSAEVATEAVLDPNSTVAWGAPCLIEVENDGFYSFATNNRYGRVPVAYSKDFTYWSLITNDDGNPLDAMPQAPPWVKSSSPGLWAPDVNLLDNGSYIMYFTAVGEEAGIHCLGAAYSSNITGPYVSLDEPWYCPQSPDQTIDPDGFKDPVTGKRYVSFKWNQASKKGDYQLDGGSMRREDSACVAQGPPWAPTPITLQEVEQDGITKVGGNYTLVDNNGAADQGNTESPSLMRNSQGHYVLFFSTGCFLDNSYTVSYAVSTQNVTGPYVRHSEPLFRTGEYNLRGPGTLDVLNTGLYTVFFSHNPNDQKPANVRKMRTALIDVIDTTVLTNGTLPGLDLPSTSATSMPSSTIPGAPMATSSSASRGNDNGGGCRSRPPRLIMLVMFAVVYSILYA